MTRKPIHTLEEVAQHVLDYATSKQLRGGWGEISECFTREELIDLFVDRQVRTKTEGLAVARSMVKAVSDYRRDVVNA